MAEDQAVGRPEIDHSIQGRIHTVPNTVPTVAEWKIREDLVWHQQESETDRAVLEDPVQGKYFRLGTLEQLFVEQLADGIKPEEITRNLQQEFGDHSWDAIRATQLCEWLLKEGLTDQTAATPTSKPAKESLFGKAYFCRISLFSPDRLLQGLTPSLGWLFDWKCSVAGVVLFLVALAGMTGSWNDFLTSYDLLFVPQRWIWIAGIWFALKAIHETAHAMTCNRYGCKVGDCGVAMILFMPIAFVDVSSSWRLPRWQRLHVTLAGVAVELGIAGMAILLWLNSHSMILQQMAADVVMLASIGSLLFNLNPLLKFDGYFALADATDTDNLYQHGRNYARYFGARHLLGLQAKTPDTPESSWGWIKMYGIAASCYRAVTVSGLIIAAAALFHGAGIVIAVAGVVLFVVRPLSQLTSYLWSLRQTGCLLTGRFVLRIALMASCVGAVLFVVPSDWTITTPAIVQYDPPSILRAPMNGFVETIHAVDGEQIQKGQPILTLRNEEVQLEWLSLKKDVLVAEQQVQTARFTRDLSGLGDAVTHLSGLRNQLSELEAKKKKLTVCAPVSGRLVSRKLALLDGQYLEEAEEIGVVGDEGCKRLKLSIRVSDANQIKDSEHPLMIAVPHQSGIHAALSRIESRATDEVPDPAFSAKNGGPLPVLENEDGESRLSEPRLNGFVKLTEQQSHSLHCGQLVAVRLSQKRVSIGQLLINRLK